MRDLAIAIRMGSKESDLVRVSGTIESIQKNIGKCDYCFFLSIDPEIPVESKNYLYEKAKEGPNNFKLFPEEKIYWAEFINRAIESANDFEYFIKAHDDIVLQTENFFPKVKTILESLEEKVAWISFNETSYLDGHWNPSVRPGYFKDFLENNAWNERKMFQFHNLPANWWKVNMFMQFIYKVQTTLISRVSKNLVVVKYPIKMMSQEYKNNLDFPNKPVRCHAPWNTFVLIKMSVLADIGKCEKWQTYNALFVDEDWGLRALEKKYWNIWIPEIEYLHVKPILGGDRSQFQIKNDSERVSNLFYKKWKFNVKPNNKELEYIKIKYKDTFIPWSIGRNSYEWDYAK
jgi:hypothetical protein